jgi:polyhydroxyalkanoate synthase
MAALSWTVSQAALPRSRNVHLAMAALSWTVSQAALPRSRNGSPPWSPLTGEAARALSARLAEADPEALAEAVAGEALKRHHALIDGIEAYRGHPYRRVLSEPPAVWSEGSTRLLDYGAMSAAPSQTGGLPLLVVPSLINRAYILDLSARTSLLRWLAGRGFRPLLVDWDRPGDLERRFTLNDYICGRLGGCLDAALSLTGRRPVLLGYCMGGLLTLALALRRGADLAGLALLATPWDFHAGGLAQARLAAALYGSFAPAAELLDELPVDVIQAFFAGLDPQLVLRKFSAFGRLDPASREATDFVALEDWLNDGVPVAAPVARECLVEWYGENATARGHWRIAGQPVEPAALDLPSLCLVPAQDRIVPPESATALASVIPGAVTRTPAAGHIGMVVGARARRQVWQSLAAWLEDRAAAAG